MLNYGLYRNWYSPLNATIAIAALSDLDLNVQCHKFDMLIYLKRRKLAQNWVMPFIDFDICHRNAPLRMIRPSLWPSFSRSNILSLGICNKNCAATMDIPGRFASTRRGVALVHNGYSRQICLDSPRSCSCSTLLCTIAVCVWQTFPAASSTRPAATVERRRYRSGRRTAGSSARRASHTSAAVRRRKSSRSDIWRTSTTSCRRSNSDRYPAWWVKKKLYVIRHRHS